MNCIRTYFIYIAARWGAGRGITKDPPGQIFKKLVHKNSIKPKMVYPSWDFAWKVLTPQAPRGFGKNLGYPSPGFSTVCIYGCTVTTLKLSLRKKRFFHQTLILCLCPSTKRLKLSNKTTDNDNKKIGPYHCYKKSSITLSNINFRYFIIEPNFSKKVR